MKPSITLALILTALTVMSCGGGDGGGGGSTSQTTTLAGPAFVSGNMGGGLSSTLVAPAGGRIVDLIVRVRFAYASSLDDLGLILQSPDAVVTQTLLMAGVAAFCPASADQTILFSATPTTGAIQPADACPNPGLEYADQGGGGFVPLASFLGANPGGSWSLTAWSNNGVSAQILEWSVTFVTE